MKKTLVLITTTILWTSFQAHAISTSDYIALKGGYAAMKYQTKESYKGETTTVKHNWDGDAALGSVAYGLKGGYLRVEAEGSGTTIVEKKKNFNSGSSSEGRINAAGVMLNSYLELPVDFPVKPYINAGAGMAHIKARFRNKTDTESSTVSFSDNHFAWQVGAGIGYEVTSELAIDLGYRFISYGKLDKKIYDDASNEIGTIRADAKAYNAYIGLRYSF